MESTFHDQDFANMKFEGPITTALAAGGKYTSLSLSEMILFSAEIFKEQLYFFKKKRILMVTNSHVYIVDKAKRFFKKKDAIDRDLVAVTQSLIMGQNNFILHFKTRADQELQSERYSPID